MSKQEKRAKVALEKEEIYKEAVSKIDGMSNEQLRKLFIKKGFSKWTVEKQSTTTKYLDITDIRSMEAVELGRQLIEAGKEYQKVHGEEALIDLDVEDDYGSQIVYIRVIGYNEETDEKYRERLVALYVEYEKNERETEETQRDLYLKLKKKFEG